MRYRSEFLALPLLVSQVCHLEPALAQDAAKAPAAPSAAEATKPPATEGESSKPESPTEEKTGDQPDSSAETTAKDSSAEADADASGTEAVASDKKKSEEVIESPPPLEEETASQIKQRETEELQSAEVAPDDSEKVKAIKEADRKADPTRDEKAKAQLDITKAAVESRASKPWLDIEDTKNEWIRTTSGEWLKGEFKELRDGSLIIDSDEFDLQTLDWDDVSEIHAPNAFVVALDDQTVHTGAFEMVDGFVIVETRTGTRVFSRDQVMSIIPENVSELSKWSYKLTLGATARYGNTQSVDYSAYSRLRREDTFHRHTLEYNGAYGEVSEELNTHKHRGTGYWNAYISPVFYLTPIFGEGQFDRFQNIGFRGIASTGGGAHVVDSKNVTLDFDLAGGYVTTGYLSVQPGQDTRTQGALVMPRVNFEWDITSDVEFEVMWTSFLVVTDIGSTFHNGTARLEIEITDIFDFDVSASYERVESPVADEDGVLPYKDDLALTVGIGLDFD